MRDPHLYVLGLGSNQWHHIYGPPLKILEFAAAHINALPDCRVIAISKTRISRPIGPSRRLYANAALAIETPLAPFDVLAQLQFVEQAFGRERRGQRWQARSLDIDILLWSGGIFCEHSLMIPHPAMWDRDFVLRPMCDILGAVRFPGANGTARQALSRLRKAKTFRKAAHLQRNAVIG